MPLAPNDLLYLSPDLPTQVTVFVKPDGVSSFYVISERELTLEERTVHVLAEFTTASRSRYRSESSLVIEPVDPTQGLWIYTVPLLFDSTQVVDHEIPSEPENPPTTIHIADGDGVLTMTGGLTLIYQLQSYLTEDKFSIAGGNSENGLPDEFLSGSDRGFSRLVNVVGGALPRITVYYYRRTSLPPINFVPTGGRIPRPNNRVIVIPAGYISTFRRPNYDSNGMSWYVTGLNISLPRPQTTTPPVVSNPTDGALTIQGNGVSVTTTLTFNGTIDG